MECTGACSHCGLPLPARSRADDEQLAFCCFGCRFAYDLARPASADVGAPPSSGTLLLRLGLGLFLALNLMAFSWLGYSRELLGSEVGGFEELTSLFAYFQMLLATGVLVLLGVPFFVTSLEAANGERRLPVLGRFRFDANLLIGTAVLAAYLLSVVRTVQGAGSLYFDTVAGILVLVALGRFLEAGEKKRAGDASAELLEILPSSAWKRRSGGPGASFEQVDTSSLCRGDLVRVRPGEALPVDGQVVEGRSQLDEQSLTGESWPRLVEPGAEVLAGSLSLDGQLLVRAERVGPQSTVERLRGLIDEARLSLPGIQRFADRIAQVFGPAVVLLAISVVAFHAWRGEPARGLFDALAVLLISCPCALGLAAPLATWSALRRAVGLGILIDGGETLERAAGVERVALDKTGTLTCGSPKLKHIAVESGSHECDRARALQLAASLDEATGHPLALALESAAQERGLDLLPASDVRLLPGLGVEGDVAGRHLRLGSRRSMYGEAQEHALDEHGSADDAGRSEVFLFEDRAQLARFQFEERLRDSAAETIRELARMELAPVLLTGDRRAAAVRLAEVLGIEAYSDLLPADKVDRLRELRARSGPVMMVGDGINDAPVLAAADVGVALGSAEQVTKSAAQVRLLGNRLDRLPLVLHLSRHALGRIRMTLAWSFAYNGVGLALAAVGLLSPLFAASAMVFSSAVVIGLARGAGKVALRAENVRAVPQPRQAAAASSSSADARGKGAAGAAEAAS